MKKIAFLVGYYPLQRGGAEHQAYLLAQAIKDRYRVVFISTNSDRDEVFEQDGFRVHAVRTPRYRGVKLGMFRLQSKTRKILEDERPELIYYRVTDSSMSAAASYASVSGATMLWHIASQANVEPTRRSLRTLLRLDLLEQRYIDQGIRAVDLIVAQAQYQCALLKRHYDRECDAVIGNFHPTPNAEPRETGTTTVSWISNIKSIKRPDLFLKLADALKEHDDIEFRMAGLNTMPGFGAELEVFAANHSNFRYLGELTQQGVSELLAGSDILVNTSSFEGFPNTFIQAWLHQVPVVSLSVDPDNVLSRHGVGILSNTEEQLQADVAALALDRQRRTAMGAAAKEYAIEHHSMRNVSQIVSLFEQAGTPVLPD